MNSPVIMLEEQLGDIHSSQIAYKLTVRNASAEPLLIMALQPHVPKGAQLMDVSDSESETGNSTRSALIVELNNLLNDWRRQKLSATPDLSGTVLPLCLIPNSALKSAPPFKSVMPKASA
ncbi:hypothetical protein, partial [Pseudomonas fragi]|uniref:hypothetical protein n=1 Tax=Pseudomonas fragi TaxID=296 RepID=UPI001472B779